MSKLAFISDIHGNWPALSAVLRNIKERGISRIYCLGDLVGYYSQINEVISCIRHNKIFCIMGNHDYALAFNNGVISRSKTCSNVLQRQLSYISSENLFFLRTLPVSFVLEEYPFFIWGMHGGISNPRDEYMEVNDNMMRVGFPNVTHLISAHSHIPMISQSEKFCYANCGSVGQPRDHNPQSSYLLFEDGHFEIVRVPYDISQTVSEMRRMNFSDYISEVLYRGCKIGE